MVRMRDAKSKDARFEFRLHPDLKARVKERPDISGAEAARHGLEIAAYGEEYASVERLNERDMEVVGIYESAFEPLITRYEQAAPELGERLRDALYSAAHEVTRDCYDRAQWAEAEVVERESDPGAVSPGASLSFEDALENLLNDRYSEEKWALPLTDVVLDEGPESEWVQENADRCGMQVEAFWDDVKAEVERRFDFDVDEHRAVNAAADRSPVSEFQSVATDGGEPR